MAEEEKTHAPSHRKIQKAREEGSIAKSPDLVGLVGLVVGLLLLFLIQHSILITPAVAICADALRSFDSSIASRHANWTPIQIKSDRIVNTSKLYSS